MCIYIIHTYRDMLMLCMLKYRSPGSHEWNMAPSRRPVFSAGFLGVGQWGLASCRMGSVSQGIEKDQPGLSFGGYHGEQSPYPHLSTCQPEPILTPRAQPGEP